MREKEVRITLPCGCVLADKNSEIMVDLCREHSNDYLQSEASREDFHPENIPAI
jgi:hypothetical protein